MFSSYRYYALLRLPAILLDTLHSSLARRYLVCFFCFVSRFFGSCADRSNLHRPGLGQPGDPFRHRGKETDGSPKFLSYPFEYMPCSWTPVVIQHLAIAVLDLLPSVYNKTSALLILELSTCPRLACFRGSITRPVFLRYPAPNTPLRICTRVLLPPCWLCFG